MYAKYFNHHRTENALLHRGADQNVEATNGMKWTNVVSDVPKYLKIKLLSFIVLIDMANCIILPYDYLKKGDGMEEGNFNGLLASTLFNATSFWSLLNVGKGIRNVLDF